MQIDNILFNATLLQGTHTLTSCAPFSLETCPKRRDWWMRSHSGAFLVLLMKFDFEVREFLVNGLQWLMSYNNKE